MIGQKVLHYQITEKLGEGGMGVVYKAEDTKLNRTVALKFLSGDVIAKPADQERLVNEARAAAGLHHPNICTIYEINEHQGQTFIAMAYVEGEPLSRLVGTERLRSERQIGLVVRKIALALAEAHSKGVIHRDLKPGNILVDKRGEPVVTDFGLARRENTPGDERLTQTGTSEPLDEIAVDAAAALVWKRS